MKDTKPRVKTLGGGEYNSGMVIIPKMKKA
jgi:hypothetical protein